MITASFDRRAAALRTPPLRRNGGGDGGVSNAPVEEAAVELTPPFVADQKTGLETTLLTIGRNALRGIETVDMAEALLPPEVLQTVDDLNDDLRKVEEQLSRVLPNCSRETLEQLPLVERASTFCALSKTLAVLFSVYLKTHGLSPDDHPAKSELARVHLYEEKVQRAVERSAGPRRPTSSLNVQATNRFIEHAIPDLSEEQKKDLREVGRKGAAKRHQEKGTVSSIPKKRPSGLTLAEEAAAFLAEASKEAFVKEKGDADSHII